MFLPSDETTLVEVSRAIAASLNPASTNADRAGANQALTQLKSSEPQVLLQLSPQLIGSNNAVEVQHYGMQLLQNLGTARWRHLPQLERGQLTELAFQLVSQACESDYQWPIRSKAATLLALVAKQSPPSFWQQLVQELHKLGSQGPVHANMACLVLKGVAEEVTQYGDDLNAHSKRALLLALVSSLEAVLPFLHQMMESNFGAASQAAVAGRMQDAHAHAAVVAAALDALKEHMEWAPIQHIIQARLLEALGVLLNVPDFRLAACTNLRMLCARKQGQEDASTFKSAMTSLSHVVMAAASTALTAEARAAASANIDMEEYATVLCQAMASYGELHLDCLASDEARSAFLHQMLGLTEHSNLRLAALILPFWTHVLANPDSPRAKTSPAVALPPPALPGEVPAKLSALAGDWLRKGPSIIKNVPEGFEDAADWQSFIQEFRSQLGSIMRQISKLMPEAALSAALARLQAAEEGSQTESNPSEVQIMQFETSVSYLEYVVPPIAHAQHRAAPAQCSPAVLALLEQLMQHLLSIKVTDAHRVLAHARALESFAGLTALRPQLAPLIIRKVFDMLMYTPLGSEPLGAAPPGRLAPGWKDRFSARQRITNLFLMHAKGAPQAIIPHMQAIGVRMEQLRQQGTIWASDSNIICEGLLAAAASRSDARSQVVEWVLGPVRTAWESPDWQQRLASVDSFLECFAPMQTTPDGSVEVGGGQARWELFHQLHLLERAAKRMPASLELAAAVSVPSTDVGWHALNSQLHWAVPVLLQLVTLLHSLWTPDARAKMQSAVAALGMSARERAMHLRVPFAELPEEEDTTLGGCLVSSLRSFLRQVRELVYQTLGLVASHVGGFLSCAQYATQWASALTSHLDHLSPQHLRGLIRFVLIPFVASCPPTHRSAWLLPVLGPFLHFILQQLNAAWTSISSGSGSQDRESAAAASEEVVQERLLRELTSEHLTLLCHLHPPGVAPFLWIVSHAPEAAHTAALTATAALWWPHGDAVGKGAKFCKCLVEHAPLLGAQVQELTCRDMLRGCITALPASSGSTQAELLGLARDILALRQPLSRQVLQSLPRATGQVLEDFDQAFEAATAERDSRHAVKVLLRDAGAEEHAVVLSTWKPVVPVSNVSSRNAHSFRAHSHGDTAEHGTIGIIGFANQ